MVGWLPPPRQPLAAPVATPPAIPSGAAGRRRPAPAAVSAAGSSWGDFPSSSFRQCWPWAQVITGFEVDELTVVHVLDAATWQKRRQRLQELGGPPVND
jgi:hypothetical protein